MVILDFIVGMFINISSDRIFALQWKNRHELPYGELEKNLPQFLYESKRLGFHGAECDMPPRQWGRVVVLNGPWSFTNLRIATLALNTFNTLHDFVVPFVSVDKITWYKMLYKQGKVARYCVMYIGQKKHVWVVDLKIVHVERTEQWEVIIDEDGENKVQQLGGRGWKKVHIDHLAEEVVQCWDDWFVDEVVAEWKETFDRCFGKEDGSGIYQMYCVVQEDIDLFLQDGEQFPHEKMLVPNYMIAANVG